MNNLNDTQEGFSFQFHHTISNLENEIRHLKSKLLSAELRNEIQEKHYEALRKDYESLQQRHKDHIQETINLLQKHDTYISFYSGLQRTKIDDSTGKVNK